MLKLVASEVGKSSRLGDIHDSVYNHVIVFIVLKADYFLSNNLDNKLNIVFTHHPQRYGKENRFVD